jgi:hypothetical protein
MSAQSVITLPAYEYVDNFAPELTKMVSNLDVIASSRTPADNEFSFLFDYGRGQIDEKELRIGFGASRLSLKTARESLLEAITPIAATIVAEENRRAPDKRLSLSVEGDREVIKPEEVSKPEIGWHNGDPARYIASLGLTTQFLVGKLIVPSYYEYTARMSWRAGFIAAQLILDDPERVFKDAEIQSTNPGDLVRFDERHVHRVPINKSSSPIDRLRLRTGMTFSLGT